jgi:hypothetical protein
MKGVLKISLEKNIPVKIVIDKSKNPDHKIMNKNFSIPIIEFVDEKLVKVFFL